MINEETRKTKHYKSYKKGGHNRCNKNCNFIVISRTSSPETSNSFQSWSIHNQLKGGVIV